MNLSKVSYSIWRRNWDKLIHVDDPNMIILYSRRCLEVIITDLCECELKRPRKTEPLKGIIDKLQKEGKVPSHIISSMHGLNELSTYGTHPKDFDPEQIKPVLNNLDIVLKWYMKYKNIQIVDELKSEGVKYESKNPELNGEIVPKEASVSKRLDYKVSIQESPHISTEKDPAKSVPGKYVFSKRSVIVFFLIFFILGIFSLWSSLKKISSVKNKLTTYSTVPFESTLMDLNGQIPFFDISPDGKTIAYNSIEGIQIRSLSNFSTKKLEGTLVAWKVAFSPDGQFLAFPNGGISKIGISGSPMSVVCQQLAFDLFWGTDGNIYFSMGLGSEGIGRVSANGGEPERLTYVLDSLGENAHTWPQLLPDSKTLLYTSLGPSGGSKDSKIVIQQLDTKERKVLVNNAIFGRYLSNGDLLYANNEGNVFILPFNLRNLKITGEPKAVLSGVNTSTWSGTAFLAVSQTGNLIFLPRNSSPINCIEVLDRSGKTIVEDSIPLKTLEMIGFGWAGLNISPSGNYIAMGGLTYGSSDIWLLNLETKDAEKLSFEPSEDETPVWSPDGKSIAYTSAMTGTNRKILIQDLTVRGNPKLILTWPRHIHLTDWSPDGKWIAAYDYPSNNASDLYVISVDSGEFIPISTTQANEYYGQFSPNGKWLSYVSDQSGSEETYIVSFPELKGKRQFLTSGETRLCWDRGGKQIYFKNGDYIFAQEVEIGSEIKKGEVVRLFQTQSGSFSISPDGQKFYLRKTNFKRPNPPLYLITNWFQELKTKTGN